MELSVGRDGHRDDHTRVEQQVPDVRGGRREHGTVPGGVDDVPDVADGPRGDGQGQPCHFATAGTRGQPRHPAGRSGQDGGEGTQVTVDQRVVPWAVQGQSQQVRHQHHADDDLHHDDRRVRPRPPRTP